MHKRTCSVEECTKPHYAHSFCAMHNYRFKKHGDPNKVERLRGGDPMIRFAAMNKLMPNGCHEWQGARFYKKYGSFSFNGAQVKATRWLWERVNGPIPKDWVVRHKCDNPPCVNIDHLEIGTRKDNGNDMVVRGRSLKGERNFRAKLTEADVVEIKAELASGVPTYKEIALKYGVSHTLIRHIEAGRRWQHVA